MIQIQMEPQKNRLQKRGPINKSGTWIRKWPICRNFCKIAPFHLLENGHMNVVPKTRTIKVNGEKRKISLTNGGSAVGCTPGYHFMDAASRKRQIAIPEGVEKMVNQLLRERD